MAFSKKVQYCFIISLLTLVACCGNRPLATLEVKNKNYPKPEMASQELPPSNKTSFGQKIPDALSPGSCRLVGKIIAVLPDLDPDKSTPCGQVPCRAVFRVEQIIGYGSAFGKPLSKNQEIKAYFNFTLSPSKKFFPELTRPLPGLLPGDQFQADVRQVGDAPADASWLQVYSYTLKN